MTTKEILENLPNDTSFKKWFLKNEKVLTKDINTFFSKFKGNEISVSTVKPLMSWSITIPKEHKTNLYNTLARLNGQEVIASYGISDSALNKVLREALKENNDIEASDEVKAYLKVNYDEFYKELFNTIRSYESLGTKSTEPIAKIISNNLGAEKDRPIKFCQEFKTYLTKLIKNVIDSVNNTMEKSERKITASSDASVEEILSSIFKSTMLEVKKISNCVAETFVVNDFCIYGEFCVNCCEAYSAKCSFKWTTDQIYTCLMCCKSNGECELKLENKFNSTDFDSLKNELNTYLKLIKENVKSNTDTIKLENEPIVEEVNCSDINDICKIILNGNYDNDLKAKANLYLSLCSAKDVNSTYMQTLSESIISEYKNKNGVVIKFDSIVLSTLYYFLKEKFRDKLKNFGSSITNGCETLTCFSEDCCFYFTHCLDVNNKNVINCVAENLCYANPKQNDYRKHVIPISDEQTTLTEVECWVKSFFSENVTASKKKTKWTRAEIVKFAEKNNAEEFKSVEEYRKVKDKTYLECLGYAMDINGNVIARLWQDRKTKKYYYCTHKYTLMLI